MHRRTINLSIIFERRITMDDNEDIDVTVPYNPQWHVSLNKLIISFLLLLFFFFSNLIFYNNFYISSLIKNFFTRI